MRGRGGHGHNDVLGFELVLDGMPLLTDCGAYLYTASVEWRNRFRSTAFHNVVQVDDAGTEPVRLADALWSLRYDARPVGIAWQADDEFCGVGAGHTGYERLADPVTCRRALVLDRRFDALVVRDRLGAAAAHSAAWRFHLAPGTHATVGGRHGHAGAGRRPGGPGVPGTAGGGGGAARGGLGLAVLRRAGADHGRGDRGPVRSVSHPGGDVHTACVVPGSRAGALEPR